MVSNSVVAATGDSNSHLQQHETTTTMGGNIIQLFEPKAGGGGGGFNFPPPSENPIVAVQAKFKELETGFKTWLSKQSIAVEAAVVTATSAVQGAAIGAFMGTITGDVSTTLLPPDPSLGPQALASFQQAQALAGGPLIQARNFAVMTGVNAGISSVMKRLRGKDDVQTSMVAAFGSGAMFSLVSGMGSPNQLQNVITSGIFFALVQGGIFTVAQKFSVPPTEDLFYARTRSMLSNLGLQNYEKNFKRGLALRDVKIPPGPRLLILDHIQRDPELQESRGKL
ncbi:Chloroplastic import inner membrane translocase subunit HP30-2-like protein [Drosera capensis]